MNRIFLLLAATLCCVHSIASIPKSYADYSASSGFVLDSLDARDPQVLDNLETLAKVWGYAKYHHPVFCDSMFNVDYELFELLPKVARADKQTRNRILYDWVKGLGDYKPNKPMYDEALAGMGCWSTVDLGWTADTMQLGCDLSVLLPDLRYAERGENQYVLSARVVDGIWRPIWHNEADYKNITKFESGYCLLALFRLWNLFEYYAPNKPLNDRPWNEVLTEYIPRMGVAADMRTFQRNYMSLIHELCDGHAYFLVCDYYFGSRSVPVWTKLIGDRLIVTNPEQAVGLQPGDEIVSVDGQRISDRLEDVRRYAFYSNEAGYRQAACHYPLGSKSEQCVLHYRRNDITDSLVVSTIPASEYTWYVDPASVRKGAYRMLNDSVGYIYAATFTDTMLDDAMAQFRNTKAIVVDLRTYPQQQWSIVALAGEHLMGKPTPYILHSYPTLATPGEFYLMSDHPLYRGVTNGEEPQNNPDAYKGRIVVLVNELTQSASETSAMALQARPGTLVVGSQTAGTNGQMVPIPLTGGLWTHYSSQGACYPDGGGMQRKGIRIDIEVRPTVEGIRAGRDEILEKALEIIRTGEDDPENKKG